MSFNPNLLVKLEPSSLFTQPATIPGVMPQKYAPQMWTYQASSDTTIEVQTNGYFTYFADWQNTLIYNDGQFLHIGDLIYCVCSDGTFYLMVTGVGQVIETTVYGIGYIQTPITSARFKTIYSAPLEILPPQGATEIISVHRAILTMDYLGVQYASGGAIALQADSTVHGAGTLLTATIAAATVNGWTADSAILVAGVLASAATSALANKGLYLSAQTGDFATGTGTFLLNTYYSVFSL